MPDSPEIRPASTVVLLRDGEDGIETLLLQRNKALKFAGGLWVFPGGSLDPEDMQAAGGDPEAASRIAAAREAVEECGQSVRPEDMVLISHWTTPEGEKKRFSTWIYAAPLACDAEVAIDGSEIHDHRWVTVRQALQEQRTGELKIMPPTMVTLQVLSRHDTVDELLSVERDSPVPRVLPVIRWHGDTIVAMYHGDAGYEAADPSMEGPLHRAIHENGHWRYICDNVEPAIVPLVPQS